MNWKKQSLLLIVVALTFIVVSCNPDKNLSPVTTAFTPLSETIQMIPTLTPTSIATPSITPVATNTVFALPSSIGPTEEFSGKNSFGDGYIAHIPIDDAIQMDREEIATFLVTQLLEHYKTESTQRDAMLKDYKIDEIVIVDTESHKNNPALPFTVGVRFSILPAQTPNVWASLSGDISPDDPWWHLVSGFAIYGNENVSTYYWLGGIPPGG